MVGPRSLGCGVETALAAVAGAGNGGGGGTFCTMTLGSARQCGRCADFFPFFFASSAVRTTSASITSVSAVPAGSAAGSTAGSSATWSHVPSASQLCSCLATSKSSSADSLLLPFRAEDLRLRDGRRSLGGLPEDDEEFCSPFSAHVVPPFSLSGLLPMEKDRRILPNIPLDLFCWPVSAGCSVTCPPSISDSFRFSQIILSQVEEDTVPPCARNTPRARPSTPGLNCLGPR